MSQEMEARLAKIFAQTTAEERREIEQAAAFIRDGRLVALPTETVYGLGANALDAEAVKSIYEAKGRPSDNPLILHVCSMEMADSVVRLNWRARYLMERFWPGPLSLVLFARDSVPLRTRGGLETAAIRMPDNRLALELIRASGVPIAAPSANISGRPSPTDAQTVRDDVGGKVAAILDGGACRVGVESTVIDITGDDVVLLRPGGLAKEDIEKALGITVMLPQDGNIIKRSPGTRYRHYAPQIPLFLTDAAAEPPAAGKKWAWMGLSEPAGAPSAKIIFTDKKEYARELFRAMRALENSGAEFILAEKTDTAGIGRALMERLTRASGI